MAEIIKTDGTRMDAVPANGTDFSLEEMQKIVGGLVEIIDLDEDKCIVLNEEGKIDDLPFNEEATKIFRSYFKTGDYIVGDVLICDNEQIR